MPQVTPNRTDVDTAQLAQGVVDGLSQHVAVLDQAGTIIAVNRAWRGFAAAESAFPGTLCEGSNYLEVCRRAAANGCDDARQIELAIDQVARGRCQLHEHEYVCDDAGTSIWYSVRITRFRSSEGELRIVLTHHDSTWENMSHHAMVSSQQRLQKQSQAMLEMAKLSREYSSDLPQFQRRTLTIMRETLDAARVSIWMLNGCGDTLAMTELSTEKPRGDTNIAIHRDDYPEYFRAIAHDPPVICNDAWTDPRTARLTEHYLKPMNITSMLDTPLQVDGVPAGVLCVEHVGTQRTWSLDEINFAYTVSSQLALAMEAERRRFAEQARSAINQRLIAAHAEAEAANRAKSEFLGNISHEIRSPMNAIVGYVELLASGRLDQSEQARSLRTVRRNANHLLRLVEDVLDLSKIEAGCMTVEQIPCSPFELVEEAVDMLRHRAVEKHLKLEVHCPAPIPRTIHTDPTRLRQVLINLVGNAIKFTQDGHVKITLELGPEIQSPEGPRAQLRLCVADTGIGMNSKQIERIFKPFVQADASTTRRFGGTGLGLAIAGRLAHLMGATLTVCSQPGEGTTFCVNLDAGPAEALALINPQQGESDAAPSAAEDEAADRLADHVDLSGTRLLVAEDGPDNQMLLKFLLEEAGAHVALAADGEAAVAQALQAQRDENPFDIILMDMQMPTLDGYQATARLRSHGYIRPIIALTAHAASEDRARCLASGCDDYMTKPINRPTLLGTIARRLARA
ncbi:MAG: ATP-binding protein [Phycisphaeraceae bacterium]